MPGPGRYEEYRYNESPKWSMHRRFSSESKFDTHAVFPQTTVKIVPGPGTYVNQEAIEHNLDGQYHLSNHRNSKAKVFNPPRSKRFNKSSFCLVIQLLMCRVRESINLRMTCLMRGNTCCLKMCQLERESFWTEGDSHSPIYLLEDHSVSKKLLSAWAWQLQIAF